MMRLVVKHVQHGRNRRLFIGLALAVRIRQGVGQETRGRILKELFHPNVLLLPRDPQFLKLVV